MATSRKRLQPLIKLLHKIPVLSEPLRVYERRQRAITPYKEKLKLAKTWSFKHTEFSNYYYDLTARNQKDLAFLVSFITKVPHALVEDFHLEVIENKVMKKIFLDFQRTNPDLRDSNLSLARRLGWYSLLRVTKPKLVVETGVHHGIGALAICAALKKNYEEGFEGHYLGIDINPDSGALLTGDFKIFGDILIGNSLDVLQSLSNEIDFFINDSDHSAEYEAREYSLIYSMLSPHAIVLGDSSHASDSLRLFSELHGRDFLFFQEVPKNHFYPGAGIGISFNSAELNSYLLRMNLDAFPDSN